MTHRSSAISCGWHSTQTVIRCCRTSRSISISTVRRLTPISRSSPGIVRDITQILAGHAVNIEELTTGVASGSFSGGTLFRATALVRAPGAAAVDAMRLELEQLGNELMVDIQPAPAA